MNYLHTNQPHPQGELCVRGDNIFQGYYKKPDITKESVDEDGWFHTGDVAEFLPNGCIKIIDRKKNLFKLSQGEYIAPEKLENVYVKSPYVGQIFVHGDSLKTYIVSIITLDEAICKQWASENGHDPEGIYSNEELVKVIKEDLLRLATEAKVTPLTVVQWPREGQAFLNSSRAFLSREQPAHTDDEARQKHCQEALQRADR